MSAAELKQLKREVKKYIDQADERATRMVYALLETDAEITNYSLTREQEAILDERMVLDEKGQMNYSTWEEMEKRITAR